MSTEGDHMKKSTVTAILIFVLMLTWALPARGVTKAQAKPDQPCGPAPSIEGTIWDARDSTGERSVLEFKKGSALHYQTPNGPFTNATWKQTGNCIYFEMNERYIEFNGRISGDQMEGESKPRFGRGWTWKANRRGAGSSRAAQSGTGKTSWEIKRVAKVARSTEPPSGLFRPPSLKRGFQWWQVFIDVENVSGMPQAVASPNSGIFLSQRGGKAYPAVEVLWEGQRKMEMEIAGGKVSTTLKFLAGETGTLSPVFQVSESTAESEVQIHFLDASPVSLAAQPGPSRSAGPPRREDATPLASAPAAGRPPAASAGASAPVIFRGDQARTGALASAGPTQTPSLKWKFKTKGPIVSSPVAGETLVYFGSSDGYLYAVDFKNGEEKWKFKTQAQIVSSPALGKGSVVVGSNDGTLYAVDSESGREKWRLKLEFNAMVWSSPLILDQTVYFGSLAGDLYAVDLDSGREEGRFKAYAPISCSPAAVGEALYFITWNKDLFAFDIASKSERWKLNTGSFYSAERFLFTLPSSPAVKDGVVYFASSDAAVNPGYALAVDAATGKELWRFTPVGYASSKSTLMKKVDSTATLRLNLGSAGTNTWTPVAGEHFSSSPAVADGVVLIGRDDGRLYALDAKTGQKRWEFTTRGVVQSSPAAAGGLVFFGSGDSNFYAVEIRTGAEKWRFATKGSIVSSAVIADGAVLFGSADGHLYALK